MPTYSVTLRLTNRICVAELSSVRCVHITVLDKQQLYWVHVNLPDAVQLHNLGGRKGRYTGVPPWNTHAEAGATTSEIRGAYTQVNTHKNTLRYQCNEDRGVQTQVPLSSLCGRHMSTRYWTHPGPTRILSYLTPHRIYSPAPAPPSIPCVRWVAGHALDHTS